MLLNPRFIPLAAIVIALLLGAQVFMQWLKPGAAVMQHAPSTALISTPDGKLEIRTTSADQRVFYRETKNGVVCSEPSPDATLDTAFKGQAALGGALGKGLGASGEAEAAQAQQSTTNPIFTRSQAVQFLRDSMYFLCQAQLNGKLNDEAYMKKFDDLVKRSYDLLLTELRAREAAATGKPPSSVVQDAQQVPRKKQ